MIGLLVRLRAAQIITVLRNSLFESVVERESKTST